MTYKYITAYDSPNYTPQASVPRIYGQARRVESITVHWWGLPSWNQKFLGIVNYLSRKNGDSSAHYIAEAGLVACIVSPKDAAWHSGSAKGNATSVGIEMNPRMSDGDIATLVELIVDLRKVYGKVPIFGHLDWKPTQCPGDYYAMLGKIRRMVAELEKAQASGSKPISNPIVKDPAPAKPAKPTKPGKSKPINVKALQGAVRTGKDNVWGANTDKHFKALKESSSYYGVDFPYGVQFAQLVVGTSRDGIWGRKSRLAHTRTVKAVQRALKKLGLYSGRIDGLYGPATEAGVQMARTKSRA